MRMTNWQFTGVLVFLLFFVFGAGFLSAQEGEDVCASSVDMAITLVNASCDGIGSNQACYGHDLVDAQLRRNLGIAFKAPGDRVSLGELIALRLSAMNPTDGTWGVAKLRTRASATASQLVDMNILLYGDIEVTNEVPPRQTLPATVSANINQNANLRALPTTNAYVVKSLPPGTSLEATGRLEDTSWVRVETTDSDYVGWMTAELLEIEGDVQDLQVENANAPYYGPMQAFSFQNGASAEDICRTKLVDGLMIQTPEGPAQVKLYINEVSIDLLPSTTGNTVFLHTQSNGAMSISVLEGSAYVESQGSGYTAIAGSEVVVPMDSNNQPTGRVQAPQPYDGPEVNTLPGLTSLDEAVEPAPPAEEETIMQNIAPPFENDNGVASDDSPTDNTTPAQSDSTTTSDDSTTSDTTTPEDGFDLPTQDSQDSNDDAAPGNSGSPPGQSNDTTPPGNSENTPSREDGNSPGNSGNAPGRSG